MKAFASLLAVLLMLSSTSLAQTAPVQEIAPAQQTVPVQETAPVQQTTPVLPTAPVEPTAPAQETTPVQQTAPVLQTAPIEQPAPAQEAAPAQQAVPTQQAAAGSEAAKPEAAKPVADNQPSTSSPSPTESTPSAEAPAANAGVVRAASLAPGAKLFLEPMGTFGQFLPDSLVKKKVLLVVVKERADADFVVSGGARVKKPGLITGMVMATRGGANLSVNDARTGNMVFTCELHRADEGLSEYYQYRKWADQCAESLRKAMKKK